MIDELFQMALCRWNDSEQKTNALGRETVKSCDDILRIIDRVSCSPKTKSVVIDNINKLKRKVEHCDGHFELTVSHQAFELLRSAQASAY